MSINYNFSYSGVGARMRVKRKELKISARKLAEMSGVSYEYISRLENGHYDSVRKRTVLSLASALGCDFEWLAGLSAEEAVKEKAEPVPEKPKVDSELTGIISEVEKLPPDKRSRFIALARGFLAAAALCAVVGIGFGAPGVAIADKNPSVSLHNVQLWREILKYILRIMGLGKGGYLQHFCNISYA